MLLPLLKSLGNSSHTSGFPGGSLSKVSAFSVGDPRLIPGLGRSLGEGSGSRTPVVLPGESHGWRSLMGYRPWGRKESDTTERLHFHFHFDCVDHNKLQKILKEMGIPDHPICLLRDLYTG